MIGQILGHYRIVERIGAGGMGVVFRARDERLERDVAIKVLPAGAVADEAARSRLLAEARIASALNHPHICTIHEVGEADGGLYIVMEMVEGRPLSNLIVGNGLPVEAIVRYGTEIADALAHAHAHKVIHRDLKSGNVVVTAEGHAKVLDFGLAKRLRNKELDDRTLSDTPTLSRDMISEAGGMAGTLPYMAPEVLRGEEADTRTDLWALGIVLYELASGKLPFRGRTSFGVSEGILRESPEPLPPRVPPGLRDIILRCLAKEPERRYQGAREVSAALEAVRSQTTAWAAEPPLSGERLHARQWLLGLVGAVTAIVIAVLGLNLGSLRHRIFGPAQPLHIRSLAVLPLANLSGDPEQGYFADGMTDALIQELSKIRELKVTSRTSSMHYRESRMPLPEIARELGVDAVMEGSVLREKDEVQISVNLVDGKSDKHLWTEKYRRELSGILKLQADVARAIAQETQVELTLQEQATLTAAPVNPEAHEDYLKGRYFWDKQSVASVRTAMGFFQRALEIDPNYAPAYSGLADSYILLSWVGADPMPASAAYPKAKEMVMRALVIDNSLAAAHASLGIVRWRYDWDWDGAEKEFKQALELNPSDATAHHWYGLFLTTMSRHEEAVPHFKQAIALDPLSLLISVNEGWAAYFARDYQKTIEQERATLQFWPDFGLAHYSLGLAYEQVGTFDKAIAEFEKTIALSGRAPYLLAALGHAFARAGKTGEAMRIMDELNRRKNFPPSLAAIIWAGLDKKSQALDWLEKARADRDPYLVFLQVNPIWDPLRTEPRFAQLLHEVGLKP